MHHIDMEQTETTPTEQVETQVDTDTTPSEPSVEVDNQPQIDKHQQNNVNARRRIRNRYEKRIATLEKELASLKGKDDDMSKFRASSIEDRIGDMRAMQEDEQTSAFVESATEFFGDDTEQFMQDTYRYAEYVNANEPDLLNYAQRQYGPILLHEWYKRMDNPQLRREWMGMTAYEKNMVLHRYYSDIERIMTAYDKGELKAPKSVPVPGGGRQTATNEPSDDFGVEFAKAEARHKRK